MELTYATPALLFPAVSLLFISYTNRFVTYAGLVRSLHEKWEKKGEHLIAAQIANLRRRIVLIRNMQLSGAVSLVCCVASLLAIYLQSQGLAGAFFVGALALMLVSLFLLVWEIQISVGALDIQLTQMEADRDRPPGPGGSAP